MEKGRAAYLLCTCGILAVYEMTLGVFFSGPFDGRPTVQNIFYNADRIDNHYEFFFISAVSVRHIKDFTLQILFIKIAGQSVGKSVCRPVRHPVGRSVVQSVSQSVNRPFRRLVRHTVGRQVSPSAILVREPIG